MLHRIGRRAVFGLDVRDLEPCLAGAGGGDRLAEADVVEEVAVAHVGGVEDAAAARDGD